MRERPEPQLLLGQAPELGEAVREGRRREFGSHGWDESLVPDPQDPATRDAAVLDWAQAEPAPGSASDALGPAEAPDRAGSEEADLAEAEANRIDRIAREQLGMRFPEPDEIVVVDAGSTDRTRERVQAHADAGLPIRLLVQPGAWPGVGRTIWEDMTFHNGDHSYTISRAMDRMIAEDDPDQSTDMRGTVVVTKRNETLSELECDPGSVSFGDFYPLFEAKEAAGQCWDREAFAWAKC